MESQTPTREVFQTVIATLYRNGQLVWMWQRTVIVEKGKSVEQIQDADPEPVLDEVLEESLDSALEGVLEETWHPLPGWELRKLVTEVPLEEYDDDDDDGDDENVGSAFRYSFA